MQVQRLKSIWQLLMKQDFSKGTIIQTCLTFGTAKSVMCDVIIISLLSISF